MALHGLGFVRAYVINEHLRLDYKETIVRHCKKAMSKEALHVLALYHQSVELTSLSVLEAIVEIKPIAITYTLSFPDDPLLSRIQPINLGLKHDAELLLDDEYAHKQFDAVLEAAFKAGQQVKLPNLPQFLQAQLQAFHDHHFQDLARITNEQLSFLTDLPAHVSSEFEGRLPDDERVCRRLFYLLPDRYQLLRERLAIQADKLLVGWLEQNDGSEMIIRFNSHFYSISSDILLHPLRLPILRQHAPQNLDLLTSLFK